MERRSIHVYYLAEAVRPALARFAEHVPEAYFVRHWRQGPHVQLNILAAPAVFVDIVRPVVSEVVGGFLAACPSTAKLDQDRLLPLHQRLAELEEEPGPLLPFHPDNTLAEVPWEPRPHALGGDEAAKLAASFYTDTNAMAFTMIDYVRRRGQRLRLAFDLMIATAHKLSGLGVALGSASFRSHSEAFLTWPEGRELRENWARHYAANAPVLVDRVRQVVSALDGRGDFVPFVRPWVDLLTPHRARIGALLAAGRLPHPRRRPDSESTPAEALEPARRDPFHRTLAGGGFFPDGVRSVASNQYRIVLSHLYLHFTRIGITPAERFLLCHLAVNAIEDAHGVSAEQLIKRPVPS
jgi:hypothetical protein